MSDQYAVIGGKQVTFSLSPFLHQQFAIEMKQDIQYQVIQIANHLFEALSQLQQQGFRGLNITMPYKESVFALLREKNFSMSERAKIAGAVNTLVFRENGDWFGDNTDGIGFIRDVLDNHQWEIRDQRILICGAGGAVRGILHALLLQQPKKVVIMNRDIEKAKKLVEQFKAFGRVEYCSQSKLSEKTHDLFDMVINAIPWECPPALSLNIFARGCHFYDLGYRQDLTPTPFLQWLIMHEIALQGYYADGRGMLIEQAAESFFLWRGVKPNTQNALNRLTSDT